MPLADDHREALQRYLEEKGFSRDRTLHAATRCVLKMSATGALAGAAGGLATKGIGPAVAAFLLGAGVVLVKTEDCDPVRFAIQEKIGLTQAIQYWIELRRQHQDSD